MAKAASSGSSTHDDNDCWTVTVGPPKSICVPSCPYWGELGRSPSLGHSTEDSHPSGSSTPGHGKEDSRLLDGTQSESRWLQSPNEARKETQQAEL